MNSRIFLFIILLKIPGALFAQELTGKIRGAVYSEPGIPLPGVKVTIEEGKVTALSDSLGKFNLSIPIGRYTLKFSKEGYKEYVLLSFLVEAGKEAVVESFIRENKYNLQQVVIASSNDKINIKTFTVEETKRFAATFNDPARLATSYAGVVGDNDQANNIVIRGNSPNGLLWRVEGADILNPNHLDNAGTFSDRASQNGGGVNILSAQLLNNSEFISGALSPGYGNALSGAFNIKLRKGNNETSEYTAQASLLGLDIAAEGPFSKSRKSSYLINYRYSTIGLLSALDLDFGNEKTNFQDLSFNLFFPTKNVGNFTLFGLGGLSSTIFNALKDSTLWEYSRDRYDVNFKSQMAAMGLTHIISVNKRLFIKSVLAGSGKNINRRGDYLDDNYNSLQVQKDIPEQAKISLHNSFSYNVNKRNTLTGGINSNRLFFNVVYTDGSETRKPQLYSKGSGDYFLIQPYLNLETNLGEKFVLNTGLHSMFLTLNNNKNMEPRISTVYNINSRNSFSVLYSKQSKVQDPYIYYAAVKQTTGSLSFPNKNLNFTKTTHYSAGYNTSLFKDIRVKLETYYQYLYDVPVSNKIENKFSVLNSLETFIADTFVNKGTGENYGIELTLEKFLSNNYYFLFSNAIYNSTYKVLDGVERYTRYNGKYAFSFSGGKEIKRKNNKVLGINIRTIYRGGYREQPIDIDASALVSETVYIQGSSYSVKQNDYFRIDLRVSFKREKPRYTRTLALDIQNVTSQKNIAYRYYDTIKKEVIAKYQLGIIPVLSYRVEFSRRKN